jgi:hypothetical protein
MNGHVNAAPYTTHRANATSASSAEPWNRNPVSTPTPTVMITPHPTSAVSAIERPISTADRGIGSDRSRSNNPLSTSSATPTAAPVPENIAPAAASPGIRKST